MPAPNAENYDALHRRYLQLVKQVDDLSTLREIGIAISGTLELNEALPLVAHTVQGALDIRRLTIYELVSEGDFLRPIIAKYGQDLISRGRLEEETVPHRGTRLGQALDGRSVILDNAPHRSDAYVPLVAKNDLVGIMLLQDRLDGLPFDAGDSVLFQQLGGQIAIAIHNAQLYALAVTDGLTALYVRRYFDLRMAEEFALAERYGRAFSILLFDIDHFKKFNDTHGHQTGDLVLKQFAALLRQGTRTADICCRYGGEEMAVILPETGLDEAALLANKLCGQVRGNAFRGVTGQQLSVTTSIGVAAYDKDVENPAAIVAAADAALYEAKRLGRNRVKVAGQI